MALAVTVISLSTEEKDVLANAVAAHRIKEISNEVVSGLRATGVNGVRAAARNDRATPNDLQQALNELEQRESELTRLPRTPSGDENLHEVRQAIVVLRDALNLVPANQSREVLSAPWQIQDERIA